jgi:hypothetical protein
MGSSSYAYNASSTAYNNTPITQEGDNPLALSSASGNQVGGSSNINGNLTTSQMLGTGASINNLDGGAIERAFAFGTDAIGIIADLTKKYNENQQSTTSAALGFATTANDKSQTLAAANVAPSVGADIFNNRALLIIGGLGVAYFVYKAYK